MTDKIIFFDTDCISAFLWSNSEYLLVECFGNNMILPRQVYEELSKVINLKEKIDIMISNNILKIEEIETDTTEIEFYNKLTIFNDVNLPAIGKGEAAAIVLAIKYNGKLASNNYRDVVYYVQLYSLDHISTASILKQCFDNKTIDLNKANKI